MSTLRRLLELLGATGPVTHNRTAAITGTASLVATPGLIHQRTAAINGEALVTGLGAKATLHQRTAAFVGEAFVSGAPGLIHQRTAAIVATGLIAATPNRVYLRTAAISGTASVVASPRQLHMRVATIGGEAIVAALGSKSAVHSRVATINGQATVVATPQLQWVRTAAFNGSASVTAVGEIVGGNVVWLAAWDIFTGFDPSWFPRTAQHTFTVLLRLTGGGEVRARLYNITDDTPVPNSQLSTSSTSLVELETAPLTLPLGGKDYRAEVGKVADSEGVFNRGRIATRGT